MSSYDIKGLILTVCGANKPLYYPINSPIDRDNFSKRKMDATMIKKLEVTEHNINSDKPLQDYKPLLLREFLCHNVHR